MKRFLAFTLLCLCLLSSCSKKGFEDSIKCSELGKGVSDTLADGMEYAHFDDRQRALITEDSGKYTDLHHVYSSDSNDINEFGIFHAAEGRAEELTEDCERYLQDLKDNSRAFIASYAPEELPKLDAASVKRFGNYVIYTVLPTDKTEKIFKDIDEKLVK